MRPLRGDENRRVERRLFDVHARLVRARGELEVAEQQLAALAESAEEAHVRALVAETPLAEHEWREAEGHAELMRRTRDGAQALVSELERSQDELLGKLVV